MKLSLMLIGGLAWAASTQTWELASYSDFLRGRMKGVAVSRDGRLTLAPKVSVLFASDEPQVWSVARGGDGSLYLGTGHRGRLYKIDPAGKASVLWTSTQPEIFAVAVQGNAVFAATAPDSKIYRIENGKAELYFDPQSKYVWALAFGPDNALYVAAGDPAKIHRVTAAGQGEVYYDTQQSHVTALAFDGQGRLLAGTEPNGILYRITAKDKAFVLYDANLPEIRAIVPGPGGAIYAAAMGGSVSKRAGAATAAAATFSTTTVSTPGTSITVTDAQAGVTGTPKPEAAKPAAVAPAPVVTSSFEVAGVEKSAIYRIQPDNTVETLWTSKEENAYDLLASGGVLSFATDVQGRVYRLGADRKTTLVAETEEGEVIRLLETSEGLTAATSNLGRVLRIGPAEAEIGTFTSPVHDANNIARWGALDLRGTGAVRLQTRSGNSARPDATWSEWTDLKDGRVASPNARFLQWQAELRGGSEVSGVTLSYLPQNTPPVARAVTVTSAAAAAAAKPATPASSTAAYTITVTDTGEASTPAGASQQTVTRSGSSQLQITWQADDPDGDKLSYTLAVRGEGEKEWKTLKTAIAENTVSLDADSLADGRYWFRVVASDAPANPAAQARESEVISAPVVIDNTPPVVTATITGADISVSAADAASPLRKAEYAVDAGAWVLLEAEDGVVDQLKETFLVKSPAAAGEHVVVIRVTDAAGNSGLAKVVLR